MLRIWSGVFDIYILVGGSMRVINTNDHRIRCNCSQTTGRIEQSAHEKASDEHFL